MDPFIEREVYRIEFPQYNGWVEIKGEMSIGEWSRVITTTIPSPLVLLEINILNWSWDTEVSSESVNNLKFDVADAILDEVIKRNPFVAGLPNQNEVTTTA